MTSDPIHPSGGPVARSQAMRGTVGGPLLLLALALGGCAGASGPAGSPFTEGSQDSSIRIHVTNLNFNDATLWILTPGSRRKLGILGGKAQTTYTFPWEASTNLQIEIDLLAGARCTTRAMAVDPGDDIELIIDQDLDRSAVCGGGP